MAKTELLSMCMLWICYTYETEEEIILKLTHFNSNQINFLLLKLPGCFVEIVTVFSDSEDEELDLMEKRLMAESEDLEEIVADVEIVAAAAPVGERVAYIHVSEGCEEDLEAQLKGAKNLDIQILEEESLPDIDESDMIHGLDHTGTSRDYVDDRHRCTVQCPVGCQGHLRPNEIVIYESFKWKGRLRGRRRYEPK